LHRITCYELVAQLNIQFSQGSAATDLRWGGRSYSRFFCTLSENSELLLLKKFIASKSSISCEHRDLNTVTDKSLRCWPLRCWHFSIFQVTTLYTSEARIHAFVSLSGTPSFIDIHRFRVIKSDNICRTNVTVLTFKKHTHAERGSSEFQSFIPLAIDANQSHTNITT